MLFFAYMYCVSNLRGSLRVMRFSVRGSCHALFYFIFMEDKKLANIVTIILSIATIAAMAALLAVMLRGVQWYFKKAKERNLSPFNRCFKILSVVALFGGCILPIVLQSVNLVSSLAGLLMTGTDFFAVFFPFFLQIIETILSLVVSVISGIFWSTIFILIYNFPYLVAHYRKHVNEKALYVLNLLAGWTFIGWVVALVWAFVKLQPKNIDGSSEADELKKYKELYDSGAITEDEFQAKKQAILNK